MDAAWQTLAGVLILLGTATVLGAVFERLRQSAILGYLLAGTLVGPNALNLVHSERAVPMLAELGVALLLFTIGLEFSWRRLREIGRTALALGLMQIGFTIALGWLVAQGVAGFSWQAGAVVGAILALSSTACVLRVLVDRAELDSVHGRLALAVLLLQDLAVVVLVLGVPMLGGDMSLSEAARALLRAVGLIAALMGGFYLLSRYVVARLLRSSALVRNRELPVLAAVVIALGAAWAAHAMHLSPILGAFVAGMLLGESPFAVQVRSDVAALRSLFVTMFFVSIGMLGDPVWAAQHIGPVMLVVGGIVIGKTLVIALAGKLVRLSWGHALATGICLAQVGEFSFVLAAEGLSAKVIDAELFKLLVTGTIITLIVTPYLVALAPWLSMRLSGLAAQQSGISHDEHALPGLPEKNHVVVIGYGPAGQQVARVLQRAQVPTAVIELNPRSAALAEQAGLPVQVGDARAVELLERVRVGSARGVVVTVPSRHASVQVIQQIRAMAPWMRIIARGRYHVFIEQISAAGAGIVIDEEESVGRRLGAAVLPWIQTPETETTAHAQEMDNENDGG